MPHMATKHRGDLLKARAVADIMSGMGALGPYKKTHLAIHLN